MIQAGSLTVLAPMWLEEVALRRGATSARVVRTGAGPQRALRAATQGFAPGAAVVAIAGVCGSVDPGLAPGETLVASEVRGPRGAHACRAPDVLVDALAEHGIPAQLGAIQCMDHVVRGAERDRVRDGGAVAVDMESAWLAEGARGRPLAVLRIVLDGPGREFLRLSLLTDGWRALGALEAAVPALEAWASRVAEKE